MERYRGRLQGYVRRRRPQEPEKGSRGVKKKALLRPRSGSHSRLLFGCRHGTHSDDLYGTREGDQKKWWSPFSVYVNEISDRNIPCHIIRQFGREKTWGGGFYMYLHPLVFFFGQIVKKKE